MFDLFFEDIWSLLSTIFLLIVLVFITVTIKQRKQMTTWGRRTLFLAVMGLLLCAFAVLRDDYVLAMQGGTGLFSLESFQIQGAYKGAIFIAFSVVLSIIVKNQKFRKGMFYLLSAAIAFKILIIEISRIAMI
ncbi:MAG TPA: hypothetical protein DDZ89_17925 [Clostridiales bacterium]|mgnify:CR=1 FL=1|nr:hypothetical protein [Clostridiales bacterium]